MRNTKSTLKRSQYREACTSSVRQVCIAVTAKHVDLFAWKLARIFLGGRQHDDTDHATNHTQVVACCEFGQLVFLFFVIYCFCFKVVACRRHRVLTRVDRLFRLSSLVNCCLNNVRVKLSWTTNIIIMTPIFYPISSYYHVRV